MFGRARGLRVVVALTTAICAAAAGTSTSTAAEGSRFRPAAAGPLGVVATESAAAARVGRAVLESGGNAIDAAVATTFA
ncbi:MAG: gamma-glutamyltransferase, partial [Actinomycetota bacterium]|nr:gamma-glutamyltransferase [Actinomycetota bacterium]